MKTPPIIRQCGWLPTNKSYNMEVALLPEYESGSLYGMGGSQSRTKWLSVSGIIIHHDRKDYSEWMFRSVESRQLQTEEIVPFHTAERVRGSICINNRTFGRYAGELSIAKKDMPADERVNVVGYVSVEMMKLLDLTDSTTGIQMIEVEKDES